MALEEYPAPCGVFLFGAGEIRRDAGPFAAMKQGRPHVVLQSVNSRFSMENLTPLRHKKNYCYVNTGVALACSPRKLIAKDYKGIS
ncbi:MAG: hypothetical protein OEW88_08215 [Gammaproteobacteria bacterium]|nr:hypothetical protein [Gammaproteobacteria bacterium]